MRKQVQKWQKYIREENVYQFKPKEEEQFFVLNKKNYNILSEALAEFGADIKKVSEVQQQEPELVSLAAGLVREQDPKKPEIPKRLKTTMFKKEKGTPALTKSRLEKEKYVVKVSRTAVNSIIQYLQNLSNVIDDVNQAKNWYNDLNKVFVSLFQNTELQQDSEVALFALLFASTSPQTNFVRNTKDALSIYKLVKYDIKNNPKIFDEFIKQVPLSEKEKADAKKSGKEPRKAVNWASGKFRAENYPEFMELKLFQLISTGVIMGVSSKFTNIHRILSMYHSGNLTKESARDMIASSVDLKSETKGGVFTTKLVGRMKVANFALNLLDPEFSNVNENWFNITIDSWMLKAIYPEVLSMHASDMYSKIKNPGAKSEISWKDWFKAKVFSHGTDYYYVASVFSNLAKKIKVVDGNVEYDPKNERPLRPHELQALVWVAVLKEERPNAPATLSEATSKLKEEAKRINIFVENGKENMDYLQDAILTFKKILDSLPEDPVQISYFLGKKKPE
jgi:hypothetical protein